MTYKIMLDAIPKDIVLQEEEELKFIMNALCGRLEAGGVKPITELIRINKTGSNAISAALCKRAEELHPEFLVSNFQPCLLCSESQASCIGSY